MGTVAVSPIRMFGQDALKYRGSQFVMGYVPIFFHLLLVCPQSMLLGRIKWILFSYYHT